MKNSRSAGTKILLFKPFQRLPENSEQMIESLSLVSGIQPADLRYKITGLGIARLKPDPPAEKIQDCVSQMKDLGIAAEAIATESIKNRLPLPLARKVEISGSSVMFFNGRDNCVLTVDKNTSLLVIAVDLSGSAVEKPILAMHFDAPIREKTFDQALQKISTARPAAIFISMEKNPATGVFVDHKRFSYPSLGEEMSISAAVNFRKLVEIVTNRAGSVATDHMFGAARLPGAVPDFSGGKNDILAALHLYTRYVLAAAKAGLIGGPPKQPSTKSALAGTIKPGHKKSSFSEPEVSDTTSQKQSPALKPPPEKKNSIFAGFFGAGLQEGLIGFVFAALAFFWFFFNNKTFDNPLLWKTAGGIGLICAGALIFSYSLVLVHYKRMMENTPTSKVRSVAMGMAELEGRTKRYYDLRSPHTNTKCIYYQCTYKRRVHTSKGSKWRIEKILNSGLLPFYLEDSTGLILVRPKGALMLIDKNRQDFWGGQSPWLSADLQDKNRKICESIIAEGAKIYVLGSANTQKVGPDFKQQLVERLRKLKSDPDSLAAYDANNDGHIDEQEWDTARKDMETMVLADSLANGKTPDHQIVIEKSRSGMMPFMIADSEAAIIRKLRLRTWLFLPGGLVAAALGLHMLLTLMAP